MYMYVYILIYIYTHVARERERDRYIDMDSLAMFLGGVAFLDEAVRQIWRVFLPEPVFCPCREATLAVNLPPAAGRITVQESQVRGSVVLEFRIWGGQEFCKFWMYSELAERCIPSFEGCQHIWGSESGFWAWLLSLLPFVWRLYRLELRFER